MDKREISLFRETKRMKNTKSDWIQRLINRNISNKNHRRCCCLLLYCRHTKSFVLYCVYARKRSDLISFFICDFPLSLSSLNLWDRWSVEESTSDEKTKMRETQNVLFILALNNKQPRRFSNSAQTHARRSNCNRKIFGFKVLHNRRRCASLHSPNSIEQWKEK